MKRLFSILAIVGIMAFGTVNASAVNATTTAVATTFQDAGDADDNASFTQVVKERFIEGGPFFMGIVLLCLILGLAIAIERIIYLIWLLQTLRN